jgi:competence protein ComEA
MGKGVLIAVVVAVLVCAVTISQGDTLVVNINTASEADLDELPGIGPARARAIVSYRTTFGPFQKKEDITKVYGIGQGIYMGIQEMITVGEEGEAPGEVRRESRAEEEAPRRRVTTERERKTGPAKRVSTTTVTTTTKKIPVNDSQQVFYGGKRYIPRGCWSCKEAFFVPDDLKDGWCPFCGKKWSVR